mmetsp:Transcript_29144/g.45297  ORF Transcript_29144/g.45297 Transcript_29144/m.45297 type:complete len:135 (+) Transcript_29144:304-708(+)
MSGPPTKGENRSETSYCRQSELSHVASTTSVETPPFAARTALKSCFITSRVGKKAAFAGCICRTHITVRSMNAMQGENTFFRRPPFIAAIVPFFIITFLLYLYTRSTRMPLTVRHVYRIFVFIPIFVILRFSIM